MSPAPAVASMQEACDKNRLRFGSGLPDFILGLLWINNDAFTADPLLQEGAKKPPRISRILMNKTIKSRNSP
jgi:hypothetical protein